MAKAKPACRGDPPGRPYRRPRGAAAFPTGCLCSLGSALPPWLLHIGGMCGLPRHTLAVLRGAEGCFLRGA